MAECFKIVDKGGFTYDGSARPQWKPKLEIEISHPPEAVEEIEVPVMSFGKQGWNENIEYEIGHIKLHRCKLCGMIILDGDCEVVK